MATAALCAVSLVATPPSVGLLMVANRFMFWSYTTLSGYTEQMADAVAQGARAVPGTQVIIKRVGRVTAEDLFAADAIVLGSPVYWSNMAAEVKPFIDDWQFKFGVFPEFKLKIRLARRLSPGQISSGKELTMLSILAAMLGNYMVVVSGAARLGFCDDGRHWSGSTSKSWRLPESWGRVAEVAAAINTGFELQQRQTSGIRQ